MSAEPVRVRNYLDAADTNSTLAGVARARRARRGRPDELVDPRLRPARRASADGPIDVGNAGTLMRLLPGWLAAQEGRAWTLDGDESIRRRPVDRIAEPLRAMGARIEARDGRFAAVHRPRLAAAAHRLRAAGRQRPGEVLRAARRRSPAAGETTVVEPAPSRDHTERMLAARRRAVVRDGPRVSVGQRR